MKLFSTIKGISTQQEIESELLNMKLQKFNNLLVMRSENSFNVSKTYPKMSRSQY